MEKNGRGFGEKTVLMYVVEHEYIECVHKRSMIQALLDEGADLYAENSWGNTVWSYCESSLPIIECLLAKWDPQHQNHSGQTFVHEFLNMEVNNNAPMPNQCQAVLEYIMPVFWQAGGDMHEKPLVGHSVYRLVDILVGPDPNPLDNLWAIYEEQILKKMMLEDNHDFSSMGKKRL